ncbi:MAG TPA: DUF1049 domain-containing protein [Erythrobacter sp.]|nr:DUF1049 domain-containing protein [Erythrobacter sp.]
MQILRTVFWALILFGLLTFSFFNWDPVEVNLWSNLVLETKVPVLVIVSFLLGLIPTWLLHRGTKWRLTKRISTLENAARSNALARHEPAGPARAAPTPDAIKDPAAKNDTLTPAKDNPA